MPIASPSSPRLVAIVGGSGFIGTAVSEAFASAGWRVLCLSRVPENARHLKPLGDLGQVGAKKADVRVPASLYAGFEHADAVVNLATFSPEGAANVAAAAAARNVQALVHVSTIGADANSPIPHARAKGEAEAAVRAAFPSAAIVRPGAVFGANDDFTNRIAKALAVGPVTPLVAADAQIQPVWVQDVANAIFAATVRQFSGEAGATFEITGPQTLSMRDLVQFIADELDIKKPLIDTPNCGGRLMAALGLKAAPRSVDTFDLLIQGALAGGTLPGLAELGLTPTSLENIAHQWLVRYRAGGRFATNS